MPPSKDADYWARLHVESDRRKPILLSDRRGRTMSSPINWKNTAKEKTHGDAA
jgi:hypothetical protein